MKLAACLVFAAILVGCIAPKNRPSPASQPSPNMKIPVILDTDTGNDIDDNFAIVALLRNPRFDVKLITTTDGQQEHRARLIGKLLTIAGRNDVPIGLGAGDKSGSGKEAPWVADFPLSKYAGKVHQNGVATLIDTINHSPTPITVIAIGPLQTLAAALGKDPSIAAKANFVGMQGSVFKGYGGSSKPAPEFNVKVDVKAAQKVLSAPWKSIAITPLDTCGLPAIVLDEPRYAKLAQSSDPLVKALLESYAAWAEKPLDQLHVSTTLYDTVAIYLADPQNRPLLQTQQLHIAVDDGGMTIVDPHGRDMTVATAWTNVEAYRDQLLNALMRHGFSTHAP